MGMRAPPIAGQHGQMAGRPMQGKNPREKVRKCRGAHFLAAWIRATVSSHKSEPIKFDSLHKNNFKQFFLDFFADDLKTKTLNCPITLDEVLGFIKS